MIVMLEHMCCQIWGLWLTVDGLGRRFSRHEEREIVCARERGRERVWEREREREGVGGGVCVSEREKEGGKRESVCVCV